jgi:hypothetical protein
VLLSSLLWCGLVLFIRLAVRDHHAAGARRAARTCITRDEIIVADLITGARRLHTRPVQYVLEVLLEFILFAARNTVSNKETLPLRPRQLASTVSLFRFIQSLREPLAPRSSSTSFSLQVPPAPRHTPAPSLHHLPRRRPDPRIEFEPPGSHGDSQTNTPSTIHYPPPCCCCHYRPLGERNH